MPLSITQIKNSPASSGLVAEAGTKSRLRLAETILARFKNLWGLAFVLIISAVIISVLPLRTAFEFGGDEGFEVIKAFMCSKGYKLYSEIWNDQPPVSTVLLTAAFKAWGPTILTARLVAAAFGLLLIGTFHGLVRSRSGNWAAIIATFLLVAAPGVLLLSVSVMLEVPAFATALLSALLLLQWGKHKTWVWLAASGAVMAFALQSKLTAALALPALGLELLLLCGLGWPSRDAKKVGRDTPCGPLSAPSQLGAHGVARPTKGLISCVIPWLVGLVATFTLIGMTWGKGQFASSWKSHTTSQDVPGMDRPEDHTFEWKLLSSHVECVIAAAACIIIAARQKHLREISFPLTLLATVSVVHAIHRPWWNYYYLHFAIPIAWLAGWTLSKLIDYIFASLPLSSGERGRMRSSIKVKHKPKPRRPDSSFSTLPSLLKSLVLCAVLALPLAKSEHRLESAIKELRSRPRTADNPIVKKLKEDADRDPAALVYSESPIYPFHAGLAVIPKLAVIMPKRFWSGQVSTPEIIETCKLQKPDFLNIPLSCLDPQWEIHLKNYCVLLTSDQKSLLYKLSRSAADEE